MGPVCRICQGDEVSFAFRSREEKPARASRAGGVDFYFCGRCCAAFQHPVVDERDYHELYAHEAAAVRRSFERSGDDLARDELRIALEQANFKWRQLGLLDVPGLMPGKRVFEVGAGVGALLSRFAAAGYDARGIEALAPLAAHARDQLGLEVEHGSFDAEVAKRTRADLLILDNVLQHVANPSQLLRDAHVVLASRGALYASVPAVEMPSPDNVHAAHITLWSRRALALALECAGFRVLAVVKGRPAAHPHEWVCIAQANGTQHDIAETAPELFPSLDCEPLRAQWNERLTNFARPRARAHPLGPNAQLLRRAVAGMSARREDGSSS